MTQGRQPVVEQQQPAQGQPQGRQTMSDEEYSAQGQPRMNRWDDSDQSIMNRVHAIEAMDGEGSNEKPRTRFAPKPGQRFDYAELLQHARGIGTGGGNEDERNAARQALVDSDYHGVHPRGLMELITGEHKQRASEGLEKAMRPPKGAGGGGGWGAVQKYTALRRGDDAEVNNEGVLAGGWRTRVQAENEPERQLLQLRALLHQNGKLSAEESVWAKKLEEEIGATRARKLLLGAQLETERERPAQVRAQTANTVNQQEDRDATRRARIYNWLKPNAGVGGMEKEYSEALVKKYLDALDANDRAKAAAAAEAPDKADKRVAGGSAAWKGVAGRRYEDSEKGKESEVATGAMLERLSEMLVRVGVDVNKLNLLREGTRTPSPGGDVPEHLKEMYAPGPGAGGDTVEPTPPATSGGPEVQRVAQPAQVAPTPSTARLPNETFNAWRKRTGR